jgi:hypothetical protein
MQESILTRFFDLFYQKGAAFKDELRHLSYITVPCKSYVEVLWHKEVNKRVEDILFED